MPKEIKTADKELVKCVALGEDVEGDIVEVVDMPPAHTNEEKIAALETRQMELTQMLDNVFEILKGMRDNTYRDHDEKMKGIIEKKGGSDMAIPEGTVLYGKTKGLSYFLQVKEGGFYIGKTKYESLSAAAEGVSGVRRSGWSFWRLPDGKTVKEVFRG